MGLFKRLLGGARCGRTRPGGIAGGILPGRRTGGDHGHLESCAQCRAQQQRERQYLERLREAAVPEASDDLTARLLARTQQLAAERQAREPAALDRGSPPDDRVSAALLAGGAAAALALMAGTAYLMGGDPSPAAGGTETPAFSSFTQQDAPAALVSGGSPASGDARKASLPGEAGPGAGIGLSLSGEPDLAPAGALTAGQLATLRSQGWTCPELRELGFHMIWARSGVVSGEDVLELRLTDGRHFATVLEQHGALLPQRPPAQQGATPSSAVNGLPGAGRPPGGPPVNILTGHTSTADGFTVAGPDGPGRVAERAGGSLWVNTAAPYRAIYQTATVTFTYVSDQPATQAGDGVAALIRSRAGAAGDAPAPGGVPERMERGLGRILGMLAP